MVVRHGKYGSAKIILAVEIKDETAFLIVSSFIDTHFLSGIISSANKAVQILKAAP